MGSLGADVDFGQTLRPAPWRMSMRTAPLLEPFSCQYLDWSRSRPTNRITWHLFLFSTRVRFVFCITPLKLPGARFKKKCRGPLLVVYFTVKLWLPQMLPNFGYGHQIMPTDIKKQGLPQMSANRPNIWSTGFYIFLMSWFDVYVWIALVQRQKLRRVQDV